MKIAIIGATGLLGQELTLYFKTLPKSRVFPLSHADIEITDHANVADVLRSISPDIVINSAAIVSVDACEADTKRCFAVNREGVLNILHALMGLENPAIFVHISSSEVFGRIHKGEYLINGYGENDEPKPYSAYQRSKKEAEDILISFAKETPAMLKKWFIVRAAWLYGRERKTFVENFIEDLTNKKELIVVEDQWRSPTWTHDFAKGLWELLSGNYENGIYHIASEVKPGEATTVDVLNEIQKYINPEKPLPTIMYVKQKDFFKIPRAPSNVLLNTKLPKLPYWRDSLKEYLKIIYPKKA